MCGICGFAGAGDFKDLEAMTHALVHRGPDDAGLWQDTPSPVFLGHRRLAVVDPIGGRQPMWTDDGQLGVVYNGEIYNHLDLRRQLESEGCRFRSDHSDTEVLLHGYRQWGENLPQRLNGMWAFAIYDRRRQIFFLSRDRFAKKPLFYSRQSGVFAFASELTALIRHSRIVADLCVPALKKYFAYGFIPAPHSLFTAIEKIPGGCNLTYDIRAERARLKRYWRFALEPFQRIPKDPVGAWGEELRRLLRQAVERRLMADVPLGFFLSGGIDSSAVVAAAAQVLPADKIKTFSIGFKEKSFDESSYAEQVAANYGTQHTLRTLSMDAAKSLTPAIVDRLDEPMGDSSLLPTYLLCRETRRSVTVALSGDGGDELFAGYDPFRALVPARLYRDWVPRSLHPAIVWAAGLLPVSHRNMSIDFKIKRTLRGLTYSQALWHPVWLGPLGPSDIDDLFSEPTDLEAVYSEAIALWESTDRHHPVDKTLQFYTELYLQDDILVKTDRAAMMNSLEVRAPFLDIDLVDFVRRIPHRWKYRNGRTKYLLKKALEPLLPPEIIRRPKKGFGIPVGRWMQEDMFAPDPRGLPTVLNREFIDRLESEHRRSRSDHRAGLWNIWLLTEYLKRRSRERQSA
jgi:asparagine synthase (glutamine-hydrolysing)